MIKKIRMDKYVTYNARYIDRNRVKIQKMNVDIAIQLIKPIENLRIFLKF